MINQKHNCIIIYGPPGCGKSQYKEELARLFKKEQIVDNWVPDDDIPNNSLLLTNVFPYERSKS